MIRLQQTKFMEIYGDWTKWLVTQCWHSAVKFLVYICVGQFTVSETGYWRVNYDLSTKSRPGRNSNHAVIKLVLNNEDSLPQAKHESGHRGTLDSSTSGRSTILRLNKGDVLQLETRRLDVTVYNINICFELIN